MKSLHRTQDVVEGFIPTGTLKVAVTLRPQHYHHGSDVRMEWTVKTTSVSGSKSPSKQHCRCPAVLLPFPTPYAPAVRRCHAAAGAV
jgi:hypothetical protein